MKFHSLLLAFFIILCSISIFAQEGSGPENIDLKSKYAPAGNMKSVNFPHWIHQSFFGCDSCHSMTDMSLKNLNDNSTLTPKLNPIGSFHNDFCWSCHKKMGASMECTTCHNEINTKK